MISFKVNKKLNKPLREGSLLSELREVMKASHFIVEREYKNEAPVDKGDLRKYVETKQDRALSYTTATKANRNGKSYPLFIHEGTGKFKGAPDSGKVSRVRSRSLLVPKKRGSGFRAMTREEEQKMFAGMRKRKVIMSIRPNKFADRARDIAEPKLIAFLVRELNKVL